jgi:hypothetical protein
MDLGFERIAELSSRPFKSCQPIPISLQVLKLLYQALSVELYDHGFFVFS